MKKNLIVGIIRSIRAVTGLLLICAVPPFAFLFPFLFDDPKMENPLLSGSVFLLLAVVPILFLLTSRRTKTAVSQGNLTQGLFFSVAPLLGLLVITIGWSPILQVIPDLTSYGPIHGQRGTMLSIQPPVGCKVENHNFRGTFPNANYNGTWLISNGVVSFKCNAGPYDGYLNVRPFPDLPSLDNPKMENFKIIIEGNKKFEIHDERIEKGPLFEVISFTDNDGIKVFAKHEFRDINKYLVNRNLDGDFQISYQILLPKNGFSELYDIDQQVVNYVRSITKRDNR